MAFYRTYVIRVVKVFDLLNCIGYIFSTIVNHKRMYHFSLLTVGQVLLGLFSFELECLKSPRCVHVLVAL